MKIIPRKSGSLSPFGFFDDDFNNLFGGFFPPVRGEGAEGHLSLRVDVKDKDNAYEVRADMPGIKKDDIEITVHDGMLTISASKEDEHKEEKDGQLIRRERSYGHYMRQISLGANIDEQHVHASFEDGVLDIKVPKLAQAEPKKVTVDIK